MVGRIVRARPLTAEAFAPYGDVIAPGGGEARAINAGMCTRWHDQARPDVAAGEGGGATSICVFEAEPRALPYELDLIERHPMGSQAFLPMTEAPFLVVVSDGPDEAPRAFVTAPRQGVQLRRGTWHGVLTPLHAPGLFWVVDRAGDGNLEEHRYARPWIVTAD